MMKIHRIKLQTKYCDAVFEGQKKFEVRYNNRDYRVGDRIEFVPVGETGKVIDHPVRMLVYEIVYIHSGLGLQEGYVVLGLRQAPEWSSEAYKLLDERKHDE